MHWKPPTTSWLHWATLSLLVTLSLSSSQIQMDPDGGYTGIVIKINKDVPEDLCPQILSNLKILLRDSSKKLYEALNERAFFKSVSIVVPSSWQNGKCQTIIRPPKGGTPYRSQDIVVTNTHPVYGDNPHTLQTSGCGHPGDKINLPYSFVTAWNQSWAEFGDPSKLFVKEWAKLRYGIFDEHGYIHDPMYPNYFYANGQVVPTGAIDMPLGGIWINMMTGHTGCDPATEPNCLFYPHDKQIEQVTCSLGNAHFLPNVTKFCDHSMPVNSAAATPVGPSKQNVLCQGKSALEVIEAHLDFAKPKQISAGNIDPIFEVVREPIQQYVLVMETSSSMDNQGEWKWINKAAQKFIRYDLPVNSNLAIVTFSNNSKVEHGMVQVHSDQVRARLADTIPDKYHLSRSDKRCVLCAMQKVIHEVVSDHKAGTHIVLLTQGGPDTLSLTDEAILRGHIMDYNIKLSTIVMPEVTTKASYLPFYDHISGAMNGRSHTVHHDGNIMDFYVSLNEAFADILHSEAMYPTEIPELVHKESFVGETGVSSGNFLIDSTLGRDTLFGIYVEDEEDHLIKSIRFTDSKGKSYGPFHRMSSDFDLVNFKTINFPAGQSPPFSAPNQIGMTWQYTIEWHDTSSHGINSHRKSIVVVTSKPRSQSEKQLIQIKTWTSSSTASTSSSSHNDDNDKIMAGNSNTDTTNNDKSAEIVLFAQVMRGDSPVIGAKVMASVSFESTNNASVVTLSPVRLHDNGYGDPDLISGDGIYSRYLGRYTKAGAYRFTIVVDDNDNSAIYVVSPELEVPVPKRPKSKNSSVNYSDLFYAMESRRKCCGSTVLPSLELDQNPSKVERTGIFRRVVTGPVVHLEHDLKKSDDRVPPARIGDLKIRQLPGSATRDRLLAEWTAPGGDFNVGSVASYRFVFSTNIQDLLDPRSQPEVLLGFDRLERAGTSAKFDFNFPHYDKDFYVGAYGFDMAGNRGKISNLVHVKIASPKSSNSQEAVPITSPEPEPSEPDWILIGVISGVIGVLLILAIASISYYVAITRKRNIKTGSTSSVIGGAHSDETDSSSFDSDIKNIMSNPLGPALALPRQQVQQPSSSQNTPTDTNSTNVTPVYWSASQLLSKLDQKHYHHSYYVPQGPQSLQLSHSAGQHSAAGITAVHSAATAATTSGHHHVPTSPQPVSLHNLSYETTSRNYPGWSYTNRNIPEEYTITVEDCTADNSRATRLLAAKGAAKVPPPVMPKPRNITQV